MYSDVFCKVYNEFGWNYYPEVFGEELLKWLEENRVGITVGKKLGKAHVRNRTRRRIREVYRLNEEKFQPGWDIVVVARSRAVDAPFEKLVKSYLSLAERAGLLRQEVQ